MTARQAIREKKNIEKRGNRADIMYNAEVGKLWVDEFVGNNWIEYRDPEGNPRAEIYYLGDVCRACERDGITAENVEKYAGICKQAYTGDTAARKAMDRYYNPFRED